MKKKYKVIIITVNWDLKPNSYTRDIDEDTFNKFRPVMKAINDKCPSNAWNWFDHLPETWSVASNCYVYDKWSIKNRFDSWFGSVTELTADDVIAFYKKFTPNGADSIEKIIVMKWKEVEL